MQSPPISQAEIDQRIAGHLDELLQLWWVEQGGAEKTRDLELIASSLPFPRSQAIRVLDLCCGPGDVGRTIRKVYPQAHVDCIDRDPFLTSICRAVNQRERIPGKIVVRDLKDKGWRDELPGEYDVVAMVSALHWFSAGRARELICDVHATLRRGGVFLLAEPASPETPFAAGFAEWKAKQPPRYSRENWERFWFRANSILGYDHIKLLGSPGDDRIGESMMVADWMRLIEAAGFSAVDVLLRDADQTIMGARRA